MGFLRDRGLGAATPGTLTSLLDPGDLAGTDRAARAKEASKKAESAQLDAVEQARQDLLASKEEALGFLDPSRSQGFLQPFQQLGRQGLDQANFLTDPQAQFDFLQNNPLFAASLQNANKQTQQSAAARGRLSAGDTLQQLSQNTLLAASPLIQQQKQSIQGLLGQGLNLASNQASIEQAGQQGQANAALGVGSNISNLSTDVGNIIAGGIAGRNQSQAQTTANQNQLASQIFGGFSDPALKENIKRVGSDKGFNIYSWDWNKDAESLGLYGSSSGVMADEVKNKNPEAVTIDRGFMKVNYEMIGVEHGY